MTMRKTISAVALASACTFAALTGASEELKKFEHVAETTRLTALVAAAKREKAAFDEMGLRRRAG